MASSPKVTWGFASLICIFSGSLEMLAAWALFILYHVLTRTGAAVSPCHVLHHVLTRTGAAVSPCTFFIMFWHEWVLLYFPAHSSSCSHTNGCSAVSPCHVLYQVLTRTAAAVSPFIRYHVLTRYSSIHFLSCSDTNGRSAVSPCHVSLLLEREINSAGSQKAQPQ